MRTALLLLLTFFTITAPVWGQQSTSSIVEFVTVYSQNGQYYLRTIPFDNTSPTLPGKTAVYRTGEPKPLYEFDRGFDSVQRDSNNLILSNNGQVIFYALSWGAVESSDGLKSISVYRNGQLVRSYTETEVTGCDDDQERCELLYENFEQVVDRDKSHLGTWQYKKTYRNGVDEKERFLSDFPIFSFDDTVYLTDSKRLLHRFDLSDGHLVSSDPFDTLFEQIKTRGRFTRTVVKEYESPVFLEFAKLANGLATQATLAQQIGMKVFDVGESKDYQYQFYQLKFSGYLFRDGHLEIDEIEADALLPKEKILAFFKNNKFDVHTIPLVFEKWYVREEYFNFRNRDDKLARQEKQATELRRRRQYEIDLTLESIDGVYIPKDLADCLVQLDKELPEVARNEMKALPDRKDMIQHHLGLGMWMRNNWRLWAGSRLTKYFRDHGIRDPEEMSSIILYHYHDWLNGKRETWKTWEKDPQGND